MAGGPIYGKYISKEIIVNSKYDAVTAPAIDYRGDRGGDDLLFEWSCITTPFTMDQEPELSDRDRYLMFAGTDNQNTMKFEAEVEVYLGDKKEKQEFDRPAFIYVPAGMPLGDIKFKNMKSPVTLWQYKLDTKYSENWLAENVAEHVKFPSQGGMGGGVIADELMDKGGPEGEACVRVYEKGGVPFRSIKILDTPNLSCWCGPLGIKAQLVTGYFTISHRDFCSYEPFHYHTKYDEWLFFIGGNHLNVEEFDAEIEMFWGPEHEKQVIDSTCIAHVPVGLIHLGQEHRRVGKPFLESITVAGTDDYFKEVEKIITSDYEIGEPIISEGAPDWRPPQA